jgi:transcriptional regulator with XRE-family HTH domain
MPIPTVSKPKTIGEHLRKKRYELQIAQKEMAKRLRINPRTLSFWECDRAKPSMANLAAIRAFLK